MSGYPPPPEDLGAGWLPGEWMQTWSGGRFYPFDPKPSDVLVEDVAHALSMLCRYAGHVERFYSVAEHSFLVSLAVPAADALAGLLHDASEAYLVDVPRPVKLGLADYRAAERRVEAAIAERFGIPARTPRSVKVADTSILLTERAALMPRAEAWSQDATTKPLQVPIMCWEPRTAERRFLERFRELYHGGER